MGVPKNIPAEILHGEEAVKYAVETMKRDVVENVFEMLTKKEFFEWYMQGDYASWITGEFQYKDDAERDAHRLALKEKLTEMMKLS